jgi:hypothetical protein
MSIKEILEAADRANGSEVLSKVLLGPRYRADELIGLMADKITEYRRRLEIDRYHKVVDGQFVEVENWDENFPDGITCRDETIALLSADNRNRVRHVKRGTFYRMMGVAEVQSSAPIVEGDKVEVYQAEDGGKLWARPVAEFDDGRYEMANEGPVPEYSEIEEPADPSSEVVVMCCEVLLQYVGKHFIVSDCVNPENREPGRISCDMLHTFEAIADSLVNWEHKDSRLHRAIKALGEV